jgi:hypothetical protein
MRSSLLIAGSAGILAAGSTGISMAHLVVANPVPTRNIEIDPFVRTKVRMT